MRVLVTRPGEDGQILAKILGDLGIETMREPLLTIQNLGVGTVALDGVQAYLTTSANGVKALLNVKPDLNIPVFAVGDATAITARQGGFKTVHSASGDVLALAQLVTEILEPSSGALLYATSSSQAGDLQGLLEKSGFECRKEILYQTDASKTLSSQTISAMKNNEIDAILLYSAKSADVFTQLVRKSRLVRVCKNTIVVCLSQAVATKVEIIPWKKIIVSESPTQEALLNSLANQFDIGGLKNSDTSDKLEYSQILDDQLQENVGEYIPQNKNSGPFKIVFFTFLVTSILAGGASATSDIWLPKLKKTLPFINFQHGNDTKISFLAGRLKKLESQSTNSIPRLAELEGERKRLQTLLDSTLTRISALEKSIKSAEQLISAVDTSTVPAVPQKTLDNLVERLTRLETNRTTEVIKYQEQILQMAEQLAELKKKVPLTNSRDLNTNTQNLLLAIGQLRLALKSGNSFANELSSLNAFGSVVKNIVKSRNILKDYKDAGISTLIELQKSFMDLAGNIVQTDRLPEGDNLLDRSIARLSQSLSWRRTDNLQGKSTEAIVARAENALKTNNLKEAVKELDSLPTNLDPLARPWLTDAQAVLAANELIVDLQANAISLLSANE